MADTVTRLNMNNIALLEYTWGDYITYEVTTSKEKYLILKLSSEIIEI